MRRSRCLALMALMLTALGSAPASAERTTGWAEWDELTGTANDYSTTMRLNAGGFPTARVTTDSRAGSVGVRSGASSWFGPTTPVGVKYGSSRDQPYLNIRPRADTAAGASTTTYVFDQPTPPTGWAFVLGDIDADQVTISAKDADGAPVTAAQLGFAGGFNLCDGSPRPSSCSSSVGDSPTWDAATMTLTGNPAASDTVGATGWFEPEVSLSTLTISFVRRSGFPIYQIWFTHVARTISGTVTDVSTGSAACPVENTTVRLVGPHGEQLATTHPTPAGAYSFGQYATQPGYVVSVEQPPTCAVVGDQSTVVSTAADDATADFEVREIIPQPVSGRVSTDGVPLGGVTVTLHLPGGGTVSTTTDNDGAYLFDDNALGDDYFVSIDVPAGYSGDDRNDPFDITDEPISDQDFALTAAPDVTGTVTGGGSGLGGVTVTLTPSGGGAVVTTVTAADGSYSFDRVPSGTYDISIDTPSSYDSHPPRRDVAVADDDVVAQDFALERPGALGGAVHLDTSDGPGRADVELKVTGPDATSSVITDAEGNYFVPDLPGGDYEIRVVLPDGFDGVGDLVRAVTITDQGEIRGGQDFVITRDAVPPPTDEPTATTSPSPSAEPSGNPPERPSQTDDLPDTGSEVSPLVIMAGVAMVLLGLGAMLVAHNRRRRQL